MFQFKMIQNYAKRISRFQTAVVFYHQILFKIKLQLNICAKMFQPALLSNYLQHLNIYFASTNKKIFNVKKRRLQNSIIIMKHLFLFSLQAVTKAYIIH